MGREKLVTRASAGKMNLKEVFVSGKKCKQSAKFFFFCISLKKINGEKNFLKIYGKILMSVLSLCTQQQGFHFVELKQSTLKKLVFTHPKVEKIARCSGDLFVHSAVVFISLQIKAKIKTKKKLFAVVQENIEKFKQDSASLVEKHYSVERLFENREHLKSSLLVGKSVRQWGALFSVYRIYE
jgi:hypothetical protein